MARPRQPQGLFRRLGQGMWWDRAWQLTMGCTAVSPGCANCWACREAHMRRNNPNAKIAARHAGLTKSASQWTGVVRCRLDNLELPLKVKEPTVWAIWNDLFHELAVGFSSASAPRPYSETGMRFLLDAFAVMRLCTEHVFIVCTKRDHVAYEVVPLMMAKLNITAPLPNVVGMVTVCNQTEADQKVPNLLQTPWAVRGVSYEPALGPVDFAAAGGLWSDLNSEVVPGGASLGKGLDWIIMGGESGPGARAMHPYWPRQARDDCAAAGVAFMFKQWGSGVEPGSGLAGHPRKEAGYNFGDRKGGRLLDGREHLAVPRIITSPREAA